MMHHFLFEIGTVYSDISVHRSYLTLPHLLFVSSLFTNSMQLPCKTQPQQDIHNLMPGASSFLVNLCFYIGKYNLILHVQGLVFNFISTVGHSQYIIILIYYQYHYSNIAIHYCHTNTSQMA